MDKTQALKLVRDSFARGGHTPPNDWELLPDAIIAREQLNLLSRLIDPFPALVCAGDSAQKQYGRHPGAHPMHAIAHFDGQWLFYCTSLNQFFFGHGKLGDPQGFVMVGRSSDDALAQWLLREMETGSHELPHASTAAASKP